ncbi:hypothetical protein QIT38_gp28 [Methanocaldococcus fervens tailed virus 1]|uniref:Uncharacterized protein n=2 Tax=root TaxID=1 RepID=C7P5J0_METFA|nr:hypothetical protein QIT38_gp28 [Methanocaldococcus fervens tailed virus 1]ACV25368.1 hypothetical protein Mefer_1565 [Methanocaldococcus fervens AG86]QNO11498.1 hypothetical protein [Methanocaldococcus fervens tailed virus 1]
MQILAFSKQENGRIKQTYVIENNGRKSFFGVIKGRGDKRGRDYGFKR